MSAAVKPVPGRAGARTFAQLETVDARTLVLMRCVLALSAWAIILIDPFEPKRLVGLTYASLALYSIYSAALVYGSYRSDWPPPKKALHWIDVFLYVYLLVLTEGTSNIFFYFFFFAILVASFAWGFREGLSVTLASFVLFIAAQLTFAPAGDASELKHTLTHAVYLFVFGCMISYWGGYEGLLKRRLRFLQEISNLWNPRFGVERAIGSSLDRLLDFHGARSCILVLRHPAPRPGYLIYRASRDEPGQSMVPSQIAEGAAAALMRLPETIAAFYHDPAGSWWRKYWGYFAYDLHTRARTRAFHEECAAVANLLDTQALATVPYTQRDGTKGRIYLTPEGGGFTQPDLHFLAQVSSAVSTVAENVYLMEELISQAGEHERLAILRDMHDTTIQPYVALKLALEALHREVAASCPLVHDARQAEAAANCPVPRQVFELIDMTGATIREFRDYAGMLKERASISGELLVAAVTKQAERLGRFYGINVEVISRISSQVKGRVAAEALQIISEGLSNVLRHTAAKSAFVSIQSGNSDLLLEIGNEASDSAPAAAIFTPRSIHERAQALGGTTFVEQRPDGYTVVHATIPM